MRDQNLYLPCDARIQTRKFITDHDGLQRTQALARRHLLRRRSLPPCAARLVTAYTRLLRRHQPRKRLHQRSHADRRLRYVWSANPVHSPNKATHPHHRLRTALHHRNPTTARNLNTIEAIRATQVWPATSSTRSTTTCLLGHPKANRAQMLLAFVRIQTVAAFAKLLLHRPHGATQLAPPHRMLAAKHQQPGNTHLPCRTGRRSHPHKPQPPSPRLRNARSWSAQAQGAH